MAEIPVVEIITVAVLDENDIFIGMAAIHPSEINPQRHLPQVGTCDLPSGKYKWNREAETFEHLAPLGRRHAERILGDAKAVTAIVKGFEAAHKAGVSMPKETLELITAHNMMRAGAEDKNLDPALRRFVQKQ